MTTQASPELINGVDVAALKQTIGEIEANPDAGKTHWTVRSCWNGGTRTDHHVDKFELGGESVERRFQIQIDEPEQLCGSNQFANPQEYLLAATNACMMVGYASVAAMLGVELTKLEIDIEGGIDLRGFLGIDSGVANGYERLHYTVRLSGNGTDEQFQEIHHLVQQTSPNYYNLANPIELTSELIVE